MKSQEYDCPVCEELVEVPYHENDAIQCPHCKHNLQVNRDADLVDGSWKDLTTLTPH